MKKLIYLIVIFFFVACAHNPRPSPHIEQLSQRHSQLQLAYQRLIEDAKTWLSDLKEYQQTETSFIKELTDDQLQKYIAVINSSSTAEAQLNGRRLLDVIDSNQHRKLMSLVQDESQILNRKTALINRLQSLQDEEAKIKSLAAIYLSQIGRSSYHRSK